MLNGKTFAPALKAVGTGMLLVLFGSVGNHSSANAESARYRPVKKLGVHHSTGVHFRPGKFSSTNAKQSDSNSDRIDDSDNAAKEAQMMKNLGQAAQKYNDMLQCAQGGRC
jgi:hypothetical protein